MNFGLLMLRWTAKLTGWQVFSKRNKGLVLLITLAVAAICLWGLCALIAAQARADEKRLCGVHMASMRADRSEQSLLQYKRGVQKGQADVQNLNQQLLATREQLDALKERLNRVPKTFKTAACPDPDAAHLTHAGVRELNAALGYTELPAGACRPDGTPAEACAADSGVSIDRLQRNAQTNYEAAAEIRDRCQALINHLTERQETTP